MSEKHHHHKEKKEKPEKPDKKEKKERKESKERRESKEGKKRRRSSQKREEPPDVTSTPVHEQMINLLARTAGERSQIIAVISASQKYEATLDRLRLIIGATDDPTMKHNLFLLFVEVLMSKQGLGESEGDVKLNEYFKVFLGFNQQLKSYDMYIKVFTVLTVLVRSLKSCTDESAFNLFTQPEGVFSTLLLAIYATTNNGKLTRVIDFLLPKVNVEDGVSLLALSVFLESHLKSALDEEQMALFSHFGGSMKLFDIIKRLMSGDGTQQRMGLKMLNAVVSFLSGDEGMKLLVDALASVLTVLGKADDEVKRDAVRLIGRIPADCDELIITKDAQLRTILAPACEYLRSFAGDYVDAVMQFVQPRTDYPGFPALVQSMFSSTNSARAALILSLNLNILNNTMLNAAFPKPPVSNNRMQFTFDAVNNLINLGKLDALTYKASIKHFLWGAQTQTVLAEEGTKKLVIDGINMLIPLAAPFYRKLTKMLMKRIPTITDPDCLSALSASLAKVDVNGVEVFAPAPEQYTQWFVAVYKGIYFKPNGKEMMYQFARMFSPRTDVPRYIHYYIDQLVPGNCMPVLKTYAITNLKADPYLTVIPATLCDTKPKDFKDLVKRVMKFKPFDRDLFVAFFLALAHHHRSKALEMIVDVAVGKKVKTGALSSKKTKEKGISLASAAVDLITGLAKVDLDAAEQTQMYNIIASSLPKDASKIEKKLGDVARLNDVFPLLSQASPPPSLAERLLPVPIFAVSLPILSRGLRPSEKVAHEIVKVWEQRLLSDPASKEKTGSIVDVLIKMAPSQAMAAYVLEKCQTHFGAGDSNKVLFIDFTMKVAQACRANQIQAPVLTKFLLNASNLVISGDAEVRLDAYMTFYEFLQMDTANLSANVGSSLSPSQLIDLGLGLFMEFLRVSAPEVSEEILSSLSSSKQKTLDFDHVLILRAMMTQRDDYLGVPKAVKCLTTIIEGGPKFLGQLGAVHFAKGILELAKRVMPTFLPVILGVSPKVAFRNKLLTLILTSSEHRKLFMENLLQMLVQTKGSKHMHVFEILDMAVETEEAAEASDGTFAVVTSCILIWMAHLYGVCRESGKSGKSESEKITDCFEKLLAKSTSKKPKVVVAVADIDQFINSINEITKAVVDMSFSKLKSLKKAVHNMLKSPDPWVVFGAGICEIKLFCQFAQYNNPEAADYNKKLCSEIASCFESANVGVVRYFSASLDPSVADKFDEEYIVKIYIALLNSLCEKEELLREESTSFFYAIIQLVPKETLMANPERLLTIIQLSFEKLRFSETIFSILEYFVLVRQSMADFIGPRPNIRSLLSLAMSTQGDISTRAYQLLDIVKGKAPAIHKAIVAVCPMDALILALMELLPKATQLDENWFAVYSGLCAEVLKVNQNEAFTAAALKFLMPYALDGKPNTVQSATVLQYLFPPQAQTSSTPSAEVLYRTQVPLVQPMAPDSSEAVCKTQRAPKTPQAPPPPPPPPATPQEEAEDPAQTDTPEPAAPAPAPPPPPPPPPPPALPPPPPPPPPPVVGNNDASGSDDSESSDSSRSW